MCVQETIIRCKQGSTFVMIFKKGKILFSVFILFISFSIYGETTNAYYLNYRSKANIYDIRINGFPVTKNIALRTKNITIPVTHVLKSGNNKIEYNYVASNSGGKVSEKYFFYAALSTSSGQGKESLDVISKVYKNEDVVDSNENILKKNNITKTANMFVNKEYKTFESQFKISTNRYESVSEIRDFFIRDSNLPSKLPWDEFPENFGNERDESSLITAYEDLHKVIKNDNESQFYKFFEVFLNTLGYAYSGKSAKEYSDSISFTELAHQTVRGMQLQELKLADEVNVEYIDNGRFVRILPAPIRWESPNDSLLINVVFYKESGIYVPFAITDDMKILK